MGNKRDKSCTAKAKYRLRKTMRKLSLFIVDVMAFFYGYLFMVFINAVTVNAAPPYYYQNDGRYGVTQDQGEVYSLSQDLYNPVEPSGGGDAGGDLGIVEATSASYGIRNPYDTNADSRNVHDNEGSAGSGLRSSETNAELSVDAADPQSGPNQPANPEAAIPDPYQRRGQVVDVTSGPAIDDRQSTDLYGRPVETVTQDTGSDYASNYDPYGRRAEAATQDTGSAGYGGSYDPYGRATQPAVEEPSSENQEPYTPSYDPYGGSRPDATTDVSGGAYDPYGRAEETTTVSEPREPVTASYDPYGRSGHEATTEDSRSGSDHDPYGTNYGYGNQDRATENQAPEVTTQDPYGEDAANAATGDSRSGYEGAYDPYSTSTPFEPSTQDSSRTGYGSEYDPYGSRTAATTEDPYASRYDPYGNRNNELTTQDSRGGSGGSYDPYGGSYDPRAATTAYSRTDYGNAYDPYGNSGQETTTQNSQDYGGAYDPYGRTEQEATTADSRTGYNGYDPYGGSRVATTENPRSPYGSRGYDPYSRRDETTTRDSRLTGDNYDSYRPYVPRYETTTRSSRDRYGSGYERTTHTSRDSDGYGRDRERYGTDYYATTPRRTTGGQSNYDTYNRNYGSSVQGNRNYGDNYRTTTPAYWSGHETTSRYQNPYATSRSVNGYGNGYSNGGSQNGYYQNGISGSSRAQNSYGNGNGQHNGGSANPACTMYNPATNGNGNGAYASSNIQSVNQPRPGESCCTFYRGGMTCQECTLIQGGIFSRRTSCAASWSN